MDIRTKQDFKKAQEIVSASIHKIDPYSLLAGGSPKDEFDSEISSIVGQLARCNSGKDISHAIARVLGSSFSEKFEPEKFEEEGLKIYKDLKKHGLA
jgi:hypothetical protein